MLSARIVGPWVLVGIACADQYQNVKREIFEPGGIIHATVDVKVEDEEHPGTIVTQKFRKEKTVRQKCSHWTVMRARQLMDVTGFAPDNGQKTNAFGLVTGPSSAIEMAFVGYGDLVPVFICENDQLDPASYPNISGECTQRQSWIWISPWIDCEEQFVK